MNAKIRDLLKSTITQCLNVEVNDSELKELVETLDRRYTSNFFRNVWKPRGKDYPRSGDGLATEINRLNPKAVLDVGCGYHPFKDRIQNIIGIDPNNANADYQIDILNFRTDSESFDCIIALGSINFNDKEYIEKQIKHCVDLLAPGGRFYLRVNPGITRPEAPYVDIFSWTEETIKEFAEKFKLKVLEIVPENHGRLFFVYQKL